MDAIAQKDSNIVPLPIGKSSEHLEEEEEEEDEEECEVKRKRKVIQTMIQTLISWMKETQMMRQARTDLKRQGMRVKLLQWAYMITQSKTSKMSSYFCLICFACVFVLTYGDERTDDTFFVKPGAGSLSVQAELKNYQCKFIYTAQGGTHEEWMIAVDLIDNGGAVACTVERNSASYLFFQEFKMELTGPLVSITEVDVKNSKRDNLNLGKEEYKLTANSISSVTGKFKNHLEKVAVYSPLSRDDL
ncbi:myeloid-derived growth factor-like [Elysia marginata]|uniref:Myeloid-derived growth factor-like n=1 Tax=Elysia marginata TaxID=1093978 RepID=A0AAV4HEA9_9GAST|nr:myeloid-derived growth factor-like [Elysia marginata]